MSDETYYTALSIAETATQAEIKQAYRALLKKIHPDTVSTLSDETRRHAEDATRELNEAYAVLSDPAQRVEYDYQLGEWRKKRVALSKDQSSPTIASASNSTATTAGDQPHGERRRRRRRRRSHRRSHSSGRGLIKTLFRPVSAMDWLVLFGYVFLAVVLAGVMVTILVMIVNSAPDIESSNRPALGEEFVRNGAGDRDRTGDIQLGKLAFYR